MKILFLISAPKISASSRYRVYNYIKYFRRDGHICHVASGSWNWLFKKHSYNDNLFASLIYYFIQFTARFLILFKVRFYDVVVIQRELFFYLPPIFEKAIKKINAKIIFDIDDAMFFADQVSYGKFYKYLDLEKAYKIASLSRHVIVGNSYLKKKILPFNSNISIIPTPVDTDRLIPFQKTSNHNSMVVIGWIGNRGNLKNLQMVGNILQDLAKKYNFTLNIVSSDKFYLDGVKVQNIQWAIDTEIKSLHNFDIGIMPLEDNEYNRGKCGFKALQYMAVGLPVVCSPIGINKDIIEDGVNGFWAVTPDEWIKNLAKLIENPTLRQKLGRHGRYLVERKYSYEVTYPELSKVIVKAAE